VEFALFTSSKCASKKQARQDVALKIKEYVMKEDKPISLFRYAESKAKEIKYTLKEMLRRGEGTLAERYDSLISEVTANGLPNSQSISPATAAVASTANSPPLKKIRQDRRPLESSTSLGSHQHHQHQVVNEIPNSWEDVIPQPLKASASIPQAVQHRKFDWFEDDGYGSSISQDPQSFSYTQMSPPPPPTETALVFEELQPSIKKWFPTSVNDPQRRYVKFYCNMVGLEVPSEPKVVMSSKLIPSVGGKGRQKNDIKWTTEATLPEHGNRRQYRVEGWKIRIQERSKKQAVLMYWLVLVHKIGREFVQEFLESDHVVSLKTRVRDSIGKPVALDLNDASLWRLRKVLEELEAREAYQYPEAGILDDENDMEVDDLPSPGLSSSSYSFPSLNLSKLPPVKSENPPSSSTSLPVQGYFHQILDLVERFPVVILSAETGAGKTTQVPQFLLERYRNNRDPPVSVVVTQPRRIAAISVAQRVGMF
jgi:hypothetical protein